MKGLFYKEARSLWHFGKTYLLMLVIFLGLALYQSTDSNGGAVWMLYPIFFAGTLPASLIGDDEKSGWFSCCDTLPVTRRQIVTVKYITCLVTAAAVCLLAVPAVLLRHDTAAAMPFLAMMSPVGLIAPSVMLPTTYKLGATKGRVVYIVMLMVVAGVCALLVNLSKESGAGHAVSAGDYGHLAGCVYRQLGAVREVVQGPGAVNRAEGGDYPPPSEKIAGKTGNGC